MVTARIELLNVIQKHVLGNGDIMEGSLTLWFPDSKPLDKVRHPYQRTYKPDKMARWQTDEEYCNNYVKKTEPYSKGQRQGSELNHVN